MSYVDDLLAAYAKFVALPWQQNLATPQRVWMAVYPPEHERRLRRHLIAFETATIKAKHVWNEVDITTSFETWMAHHNYRDEYFEDPELLETALPAFFVFLVAYVRKQLTVYDEAYGVVGLVGAGTLFGLGNVVKVSALLNEVNDAIAGRLLVFFPGHHEGNRYRLLDARDGWNYLAIPITPSGSGR